VLRLLDSCHTEHLAPPTNATTTATTITTTTTTTVTATTSITTAAATTTTKPPPSPSPSPAAPDAAQILIPNGELVVGDVLKLDTGDKVSADCILVETFGLVIDEAALTGESDPIAKTTARDPWVRSGTQVTHPAPPMCTQPTRAWQVASVRHRSSVHCS
jgi:magnesium-transporting ATPase (P-type)